MAGAFCACAACSADAAPARRRGSIRPGAQPLQDAIVGCARLPPLKQKLVQALLVEVLYRRDQGAILGPRGDVVGDDARRAVADRAARHLRPALRLPGLQRRLLRLDHRREDVRGGERVDGIACAHDGAAIVRIEAVPSDRPLVLIDDCVWDGQGERLPLGGGCRHEVEEFDAPCAGLQLGASRQPEVLAAGRHRARAQLRFQSPDRQTESTRG